MFTIKKLEYDRELKLILLILLTAMTFAPMLYTGYLTRDDAERHLEVLNGGILGGVWGIAESSGRLSLALHIILTHIPYLSDNIIYRKFFLIFPHFITITYFSYVAGIYLKNKNISQIIYIIFLLTLTNSWEHNLYASYPFAFHVSMLALISSAHFLHHYLSSNNKKFLAISTIGYAISIATYEQFTVYIIFLLGLIYLKKSTSTQHRLIEIIKSSYPFIIILILYLIINIIFRNNYQGRYEGVQLADLNITSLLITLKTFIFSSFPLYVPIAYATSNLNHHTGFNINLSAIYENFSYAWILKTIISSILLTWITQLRGNATQRIANFRQLIIFFILLTLSVSLISLSSKYQDWVINHNVIAYSSPTYFAQLFAVALLALILLWMTQLNFIKNLRIYFKFLAFIIMILPVVVVTELHNNNVLSMQRNSANKWHALDSMSFSGALQNLPDGSIIYGPEFMQTGGIASMREGYWGSYLRAKYNINIEITADKEKYLDQKYKSKRYIINYKSTPPHEMYYANINKDNPPEFEYLILDNEKDGFYNPEKNSNGEIFRWSKQNSNIKICNNSDANLNLEVNANIVTDTIKQLPLRVCFLGSCRDYQLNNKSTLINERRLLPIGCSSMKLETSASPVYAPLDSRTMYFQLLNIELKKVPN